jgi:hypothetical protein
LISEGDLIVLLSKVSVYIFSHFMRFLMPKRRSLTAFVKGDVFSANFIVNSQIAGIGELLF